VVLPCLNEAAAVGLCVREALDTLNDAGIRGEVVVVDNGSHDDSAEVALREGAQVVREVRRGYGSALQAGIAAARAPIVVTADADFSYDLRRIPEMVAPIQCDEADLVLGSRLDDANRRTMPLLHRFVGTPALTFLIARASGGLPTRDSQSGYRAFRRQFLLGLKLRGTGMEFASEMLLRASSAGSRICEVDTGYRKRIGRSKLHSLSDGWRHLQLIVLLAPDLVLVYPGIALTIAGVLLTALSLGRPGGFSVGSLQWQPVFFSSISLVLGIQALLAGAVLAWRSSETSGTVRRRFAFVGQTTFPTTCTRGGLIAAGAGLAIDLLLFLVWVMGLKPWSRGLALAALAQTLLIVGGSLSSFGLIARLLDIGKQGDAHVVTAVPPEASREDASIIDLRSR